MLSQILPGLAYAKVVTYTEGSALAEIVYGFSIWWSVTFFIIVYFQPKLVEACYEKLNKSFKNKLQIKSRNEDKHNEGIKKSKSSPVLTVKSTRLELVNMPKNPMKSDAKNKKRHSNV